MSRRENQPVVFESVKVTIKNPIQSLDLKMFIDLSDKLQQNTVSNSHTRSNLFHELSTPQDFDRILETDTIESTPLKSNYTSQYFQNDGLADSVFDTTTTSHYNRKHILKNNNKTTHGVSTIDRSDIKIGHKETYSKQA